MATFISSLSGKVFPISDKVSGKAIPKSILIIINRENQDFNEDSALSIIELNFFRQKYISEYILKENKEISELEKSVINAFDTQSLINEKLNDTDSKELTYGQRLADKVATFGGSWTFIISFGVFILIWILINIYWFNNRGYDPYPFILLNLILSCIASIQAPVIMMSQNRQEEKDRDRAKNDYMINLKSELEIRMLHDKLDHLITHQQQELLELQKLQVDMMNDIIKLIENRSTL